VVEVELEDLLKMIQLKVLHNNINTTKIMLDILSQYCNCALGKGVCIGDSITTL
jgi:hypothetical protein